MTRYIIATRDGDHEAAGGMVQAWRAWDEWRKGTRFRVGDEFVRVEDDGTRTLLAYTGKIRGVSGKGFAFGWHEKHEGRRRRRAAA